MDPKSNPFAPGAGTQPPELAGREDLLQSADLALARIGAGRHARGQLLLGLRGAGKTVLLNRISDIADDNDLRSIMLEAPERRRLADMLVQPLRAALLGLSRRARTREAAQRALGVLRAFAGAFRVSVGDVEFGVVAAAGTADSGHLESDLPEVLLAVARAAREADTAVVLLIDELQYLSKPDLAALIVSMHKIAQKGLPLVLFGAGLPQLAALAGEAKSYAERLFEFPEVGALADSAAREAIAAPVRREGADIQDDALDAIVRQTSGYPYFLQEWGAHVWNVAPAPLITAPDVHLASSAALRRLDGSFFRVRLDRLTPRERDYVRAMAYIGPGPHRSGEIAQVLGIEVTRAGPLRSGLIKKGMIFSPQHGDTAFTVPMFDAFMRRSMPEWRPPTLPR